MDLDEIIVEPDYPISKTTSEMKKDEKGKHKHENTNEIVVKKIERNISKNEFQWGTNVF